VGDRFVYGFRESADSPATIFLYGHWNGASAESDVLNAVQAAQPRWNDYDYATRIAISTIVCYEWAQETGYGIYAHAERGKGHGGDYRYIYIVEWRERLVLAVANDDDSRVYASVPFDQFLREPMRMAMALSLTV
jgi:hypothetical protein